MFLKAIVGGLTILGYWETYVAGFIYLLIAFSYPLLKVLLSPPTYFDGEPSMGCGGIIIMHFFHIAGMLVFISIMFPILLGLQTDAAWNAPIVILLGNIGATLKIIYRLFIISIIIYFIPLIGQSNSFNTLVVGGFVLAGIGLGFISQSTGLEISEIRVIPDILTIVGFVTLSGVAALLGFGISVLAISPLLETREDLSLLVVKLNQSVLGFLPVFMYGAWLGMQINT